MRVNTGLQAGHREQTALTVPLESGRFQLQLIQVRHGDEGTPAERLLKTCTEPSTDTEHRQDAEHQGIRTPGNQNTTSEHKTNTTRQFILALNWSRLHLYFNK